MVLLRQRRRITRTEEVSAVNADTILIAIGASVILYLVLCDLAVHKWRAPTLASAAIFSTLYVLSALLFSLALYIYRGPADANLFLTGYVLEKSLSVDNLMVFAAIFAYFRIEPKYQHRVLHYGIVGAVMLRLIFVMIGAGTLLLAGPIVGLVFGLVVLWSAFKMISGGEPEEVDYSKAWYVRWTSKLWPVYPIMTGTFFYQYVHFTKAGAIFIRHITPLFLCLVAIEISDVLFAFDSVPAVIAVARDPMIVYSAVIFAVVGLRSMYFILAALTRYLAYLSTAVIAILFFVGIKMLVQSGMELCEQHGIDLPLWTDLFLVSPTTNLMIVLGTLGLGIGASFVVRKPQ